MSTYNQIAGRRIQRIEALSDGVFAIAMTILAFNLKDPVGKVIQSDEQLLKALGRMLPAFLSYLLSFLTLGIFWTGQATQFHFIEKYDRNIGWISIFFLMFVSMLPFTTELLSNHISNRVPVLLYWLNIFALGIFIYIHWKYAYKKNYLSIHSEEKENTDKAIVRRIFIAQSLYAFGALLCFIHTYLSIAFIIMVQLNYATGFFTSKKK